MARANHGITKFDQALRLLDEAIEEKREDLREHVTDEFENIKSVVSEIQPALKNTLRSSARHLTDVTDGIKEMTREKSKEITKALESQVKRHPWKAIGGVTVGALILGYFMGRKD